MTARPSASTRRRYDSTLRRERATQTREDIVAAGADLLHGSSIRDWQALTIRAVAERAGVHERTVYRHFGNERSLRDAVMRRLEQDAGIDLAQMRLEDIADVTARIFSTCRRIRSSRARRSIRRCSRRTSGSTTRCSPITWVVGLVEEAARPPPPEKQPADARNGSAEPLARREITRSDVLTWTPSGSARRYIDW